jgi:hypothetical protein
MPLDALCELSLADKLRPEWVARRLLFFGSRSFQFIYWYRRLR